MIRISIYHYLSLIALKISLTSQKPTPKVSGSPLSPVLFGFSHSNFLKNGTVILYCKKEGIYRTVPSDYLYTTELVSPVLSSLKSTTIRYAYVKHWTKNTQPGFENKRIGYYLNSHYIIITIEHEDYKPTILAVAKLDGRNPFSMFKVRWLNSGDATETILIGRSSLFYLKNDFAAKEYFKVQMAPLGLFSQGEQSYTTAFAVADDGTGCFFRIQQTYLYVYERKIELSKIILEGETFPPAKFKQNLCANHDPEIKILYIGGKDKLWFYSWDPVTKTLTHKKTIFRDTATYGKIMSHPTKKHKFFYLEKYPSGVKVYEVDKQTLDISDQKASLYTRYRSEYCIIEFLNDEDLTVGVGCWYVVFTANLEDGSFINYYRSEFNDMQVTPLQDKYIKFYIDNYAIVNFDPNLGLSKIKFLLPINWARIQTHPKDPNLGLYQHGNKVYELDESKEIQKVEEVEPAAKLLVELTNAPYADEKVSSTNQGFYKYRGVFYSSMGDGIIQIGNRCGYSAGC